MYIENTFLADPAMKRYTPYVNRRVPEAIGSQPPAGAAADCPVSVAFGPWRHGGSRLSSVGGLRPLF
jgi:hypothetical protein